MSDNPNFCICRLIQTLILVDTDFNSTTGQAAFHQFLLHSDKTQPTFYCTLIVQRTSVSLLDCTPYWLYIQEEEIMNFNINFSSCSLPAPQYFTSSILKLCSKHSCEVRRRYYTYVLNGVKTTLNWQFFALELLYAMKSQLTSTIKIAFGFLFTMFTHRWLETIFVLPFWPSAEQNPTVFTANDCSFNC